MVMMNAFRLPSAGAIIIAALAAVGATAAADLISSQARTTDGDTIRLGHQSVRIWGIAAPERSEPGGREASAAMADLLASGTVICQPTGEKSHSRIVARCYIDGRDIGRAMVATGWARDCPRYSGGAYADTEAATKRRVAYDLPAYCTKETRR